MQKLNQLSFVIGIFFILTALILFGNELLTDSREKLNLYAASGLLLFGVFMVYISNHEKTAP